MDKSPEAFRTISEVAEALETPAHVLRFWESRFPQIRPVKRAGGRRYYRPADVALLSGIRQLLHDQGMTIRGVQKILREQGVRHVASMAGAAEADFDIEALEPEADPTADQDGAEAPDVVASAQVVALETALRRADTPPPEDAGATADLHELRPGLGRPEPVTGPETEKGDDFSLEGIFSFGTKPDLGRKNGLGGGPTPAPPNDAEPVPEAPHVWVEAEPELELAAPVRLHAPTPGSETAFPIGPAARLRALPRPVSSLAAGQLAELHSRLGLLHAQMAEALRPRR